MPLRPSPFFTLAACSAAVASAFLLPATPAFAADVPIGEYASLTGGNATFGQSSHNGTELAIAEINAAGGPIPGDVLKLITEDDQSKAGETANIVRKLISSDKVAAILGEVASSRSLEAAPICQSSHVPMISPASTNPKVTEVGDYVFRVCFIDPFQGTVMAKFALDTLKAKRVALLTDVKQDYSQGLAQFFKQYYTAHGGQITSEKSYSSGDKDFRAQLTAIKGDKPDAIFVPGYYTEVGLIARQARSLGIKCPLLGGDGWDSPQLVPIGGSAMEGCYFSNHFSTEDSSPVIQGFIAKYKAKYNAEPDAMAALGYDSAMILADAIKRAGGTDPAKLRDAIAATKGYQGITGLITIDAERNATKPAVILQIKGGVFKFVSAVAP
jgi:branched-chain amino acid transport system substrate-binding protein